MKDAEFDERIELMFQNLKGMVKKSNYKEKVFHPLIFTVGTVRRGDGGLLDMDKSFQDAASSALIPVVRSRSEGQQEEISRRFLEPPAAPATAAAGVGALEAAGAGPQPAFDPAQAWLKGGRKTYRKNLRKTRKSKKKWTRTKRSRSQRS